jgi:hypothetical protein
MSSYQVDLGRIYGEALICDVSVNRNKYKMYLITFIVVDGENFHPGSPFLANRPAAQIVFFPR